VSVARDNGWTGGQYSVFRAGFGAYLFVHFTALLPWSAELFSDQGVVSPGSTSPLLFLFPNVLGALDAPWFVAGLVGAAALASAAFAAGFHDRAAALGCWYVMACLFGRNPLIANPSLPFVGWMLLAHACLPAAPYGSWAARSRVDPGGWRMAPAIHAAAWTLMSLGYSYSGYTKLISPSWVDGSALSWVLENPLARPGGVNALLASLPPIVLTLNTWTALAFELLFAPLALCRPLRPWLWLAMLGMHAGLLALIDFADLSLGMMLLHGFTFDPAWLKPRAGAGRATIFYDGHCGLCHHFVRFVLAEDRAARFQFAPLQGATFEALTPEQRADVPDSVLVRTAAGTLLVRSQAALEVLAGLGGLWRIASWVIGAIPAGLRDAAYDAVARVRKRIFAPPADVCPLLPAELRMRFLP
jgi:predicted DCC family thiol-disulfide oxidoreductase YuxK